MDQKFEDYIIKQSPPHLNYDLLKINDESRYSSLKPWHIDQVSDYILYETQYMKINTIIDCTSHIGVDTILFRLLFPNAHITAIELNPNTFKLLQYNMNHLDDITGYDHVKPIHTINDDCLNYSLSPTDIRYYDAPFGQDYTNYGQINLFLSGIHLGVVVNTVLKYNPCLVILKLPYNIDMDTLYNKIIYNINYQIYFNTYNIYTKSGKLSYILAFIKLM